MPEKKIKNKERFARIFVYLRRYKNYLFWGALAILGANGLILITPYLLKIAFDKLENQAQPSEILPYALLIVLLAVASGVLKFTMRRMIIWMCRKIEYDLRSDFFAHLLKLHPSFYHNTRTGDIMARATNDIDAVRMMIGPGIMQISNAIVMAIIAVILMFSLSPKLTLYSLLPMPILSIAVNRLGSLVYKRFVKIQEYFAVLTSKVQENLAGVRVIRAYNQEDSETDDFSRHNKNYITLNMSMIKIHCMFFPILIMLAGTVNMAVLYFGGREVIDGSISLGTLVAFFTYISFLIWPMIAIGWVVSLYQRGTASLDRINQILDTNPEVVSFPNSTKDLNFKDSIEFRNLSFGYNGENILNNISLVVKSGMTVGIIGPTASGKSTLVSLIGRMFPVPRGMLFLDGVDVNDWDLDSLRRQIGFVQQEPFLFSDTIANNILFGVDRKDMSTAQKVARLAVIDQEIETFPDSYQTMLGERGITLSGGQKQRVAIARALVADPKVLILDDATSSVDTGTEHLINLRLNKELNKRTAIIISHRISAVKEADLIVSLQDGRIAESGNHEELMSVNGYYASLYRNQLIEEELKKL